MRPAGHERGAWAAVGAEVHSLVERAVITTMTMMRHPDDAWTAARVRGKVAGLTFRAAEIVYDLEQRTIRAEREAAYLRDLEAGRDWRE